jgi:hypothetical protein
MDATRCDDFTKGLATSTSRRAALKTIAATTIGGKLGLAGIGTAFAGDKCGNQDCPPGTICCNRGGGVKICLHPVNDRCPPRPG